MKNDNVIGEVASLILGMRDLLYANIIDYKEYQQFVKEEFAKNNLYYKFESYLDCNKKIYRHVGYNEEVTDNRVTMPIAEIWIDFNLEGDFYS